ncbi:hypothetical protein RVBP17_2720 [Pseudomonas phage sp. 30-3]|nr:hypothetical protein GBBBJNDB_00204 [Pseudomonas phage Callisto]BDR26229.1 hypothetical protein RVBP17_2720 [Pseudomonas phage sp. 30-3]
MTNKINYSKVYEPKGALYRIRRISDGAFSTGSSSPVFVTSGPGKVFNTLGKLRSHLTTIRNNPVLQDIYNECEIVQYVEADQSTYTLAEHTELLILKKLTQ